MFAVLSLAPLYLLGMGILFAHPVLRARSRPEENDAHRSQAALLSGLLATGMLVNYVLVLALGSLRVALTVGCALGVLGLLLGGRTFLKTRGNQSFPQLRLRAR